MPVIERTSISFCRAWSPGSLLSTVPRKPATNDTGMEMMPGLDGGKTSKLASGKIEVALPDTTGEKITSSRHEPSPVYMAHSVPVVLNRFQNNEYSSVDRFADAANANASATRNATFCPLAMMPPMIDSAPTTTAVSRATLTSEAASAPPFLMMLAYTSWAKEALAVMVRPATTARIVANATAATTPSRSGAPVSKASSGAAEFSLPVEFEITSAPTSADAP